jgi:hypothetical protein
MLCANDDGAHLFSLSTSRCNDVIASIARKRPLYRYLGVMLTEANNSTKSNER